MYKVNMNKNKNSNSTTSLSTLLVSFHMLLFLFTINKIMIIAVVETAFLTKESSSDSFNNNTTMYSNEGCEFS